MVEQNRTLLTGNQRLDYIDALRGIAALMVLFCHSLQVDQNLVLPSALTNILDSGKYGVQLFFVISALTIFYSLHLSDGSTFNFLIMRFFRIAPLYFLAVLTYSLLNANTDYVGIGMNLFFLHGFFPEYINSVVPGGWSIGIEMVFYCMVPFLFKKLSNIEKTVYFLLVALLFSFCSMYIYRKVGNTTSDNESFVYFWLPNQLPVFALGFIVYYLSFTKDRPALKAVYLPVVLLCFFVLTGIVLKLSFLGEHFVFGFLSAVLIYLFGKQPFPGLANKLTLYLGKISYSLYLSQYAAIYIVQKTGLYSLVPSSIAFSSMINITINIVLLLLITCLLSTSTYHLIELPFQKMGRRFLIKKPASKSVRQAITGKIKIDQKSSGVKTD